MGAKITVTLPDGTKIEGDSGREVAEAAAAIRQSTVGSPPSIQKTHDEPSRSVLRSKRHIDLFGSDQSTDSFDERAATLALLEAIKAAGVRGISGETVQRILHADHPKGIGGRMVRINGYLRRLGFQSTDNLFDNPKDRKLNARVWKPKNNIDAAIEAARKGLG